MDFKSENPKAIQLATVGIMIDKDGFMLMTRRPPTMNAFPRCWVFPGGMVEAGEPIEWEVLREIEEEVGIKCDSIISEIQPLVLYGIHSNSGRIDISCRTKRLPKETNFNSILSRSIISWQGLA